MRKTSRNETAMICMLCVTCHIIEVLDLNKECLLYFSTFHHRIKLGIEPYNLVKN